MKTKYITTIILPMLALCAAGLTACEEESIGLDAGTLQDEESFALIRSAMRSDHSFSGITKVDLFAAEEGEDPETVLIDELFLTLDKPATGDVTAEITIGDTFTEEYLAEVERRNAQVKAYNNYMQKFGSSKLPLFDTALLTTGNLQIDNTTLTITAGKTVSENVQVKVTGKDLDPDTIYSLPLEIRQTDASGAVRTHRQQYIIYINQEKVTIDHYEFPPMKDIELDSDLFTVFYVNVEEWSPLAANILAYIKRNKENGSFTYKTIGNIINLRPSTVGYDQLTGRCLFSLSPDLRYVLENSARYIRPIQNMGRKVCVCIQGGGKGLGFCNMTDTQIADFSAQVKEVVELYGLDGINLRDEGSGYGKEGMPPMNTTSYPKLIKSLREAMPDKLLTLVDKEEPTEYFHDVALCGGIEVGRYIDYAWHGYAKENEMIQIVEPWEMDQPYSEYARQPIAGLSPERYGSIAIPSQLIEGEGILTYEEQEQQSLNMFFWKRDGRMRNKILVIYADITGKRDGAYGGQPERLLSNPYSFMADSAAYYTQRPNGTWRYRTMKYSYLIKGLTTHSQGYNTYKKDW